MFRGEDRPIYASIARGCFGISKGLMAFFTYLDASGDAIDPSTKVLSVGGFIAEESAWAEFEVEWQGILDTFGVPELHMREYTQSVGAFAGWKDDKAKREDFMRAVAGLIRRSPIQSVGASMPLSVYRLYNWHYTVFERIGSAYTVCMLNAIARSAKWRDQLGRSDPMLLFVEDGDNEQPDFRKHIEGFIWEAGYIARPVFLKKREMTVGGSVQYARPLQACDFIVYERTKALTDLIVKNKTHVRKSLQAAVPPIEDAPSYWALLERSGFKNIIENFKVPRRYNHFRRPYRRQDYTEPLGFIDIDHPVVGYMSADAMLKGPEAE